MLYESIAVKTKDSLIGLHVGEQYNLAALGIVGQLIQVCRTVREGLEKGVENFNLISNAIQLSFEVRGTSFCLRFQMNPECTDSFPIASKHLIVSSMVFAYKELSFLTLNSCAPLRVEFNFDEDKENEFEEVFNTSVQFNKTQNYLEFDLKILEERIVSEDYELLMALESVACQRLNNDSEKNELLSEQIKTVIYTLLNPGLPTLVQMAKNLNMSPRNLQRKLKQEDTSYLKIAEEVKKELALAYLNKNLSIKEIAYLIGYAESSAFVNAFKKWFGQSPLGFKAAHK